MIRVGDCVKLPDGRIARVRVAGPDIYRVRVRRGSGKSREFLDVAASDLEKVACPKGWMSPDGYTRYLKTTLQKMRARGERARVVRS